MRRITQEQLGERAGISYKYLGEIERGEANPTFDVLYRLAKALNAPIGNLVNVGIGKNLPRDAWTRLSRSQIRTVKKALDLLGEVFR
jgi:transcriptional regulator with XRE-family HTH domain